MAFVDSKLRKVLGALFLLFAVACNYPGSPGNEVEVTSVEYVPAASVTPIPTEKPLRILNICLANEPTTLFLYGDQSSAANAVREAIYDGPWDIVNFNPSPVILKEIPAIDNGLIKVEPVEVNKGELIEDTQGALNNLEENITFYPSGCHDESCVQTYSGQASVQIDQLVVVFNLLPGLKWSDGEPLTAFDSQYSFEIASALFPKSGVDWLPYTSSYTALDSETVEWRGVPGYSDAYAGYNFASPLPKHAWKNIPIENLTSETISTRTPLGWGAYKIDEWIPGVSIILSPNPNYFRMSEGLPGFDSLVYKFLDPVVDVSGLIENKECDIVDNSLIENDRIPALLDAQEAGNLKTFIHPGTAWEHLDFGILPYPDTTLPTDSIIALKETRQAIATCIDRQKMVDELTFGISEVADVFIPSSHPLYNPDLRHYPFEPQTASAILDSVGWRKIEDEPTKPRVSVGIQGVPDGTPLSLMLLISDEPEKVRIAQIVQESLEQCGVDIQIHSVPVKDLLAPGPEGLIFGRQFSFAEFNWAGSIRPPCFLYATGEIPGPYPEFPKGWGGANVTGYSNSDYDRACLLAETIIASSPGNIAAQYETQAYFTEDIPSIPLFFRLNSVVTRPDFCGLKYETGTISAFSFIEAFNAEENCQP